MFLYDPVTFYVYMNILNKGFLFFDKKKGNECLCVYIYIYIYIYLCIITVVGHTV